jgi:hypothetical protein
VFHQNIIKMTDTIKNNPSLKFTGYMSILGAVTMLIGAALWGASGTDLWQALANQEMEAHLSNVAQVKPLLVANTVFWCLGVLMLATAGTLIASLSDLKFGLNQLAVVCMRSGASLGIVAFIVMLSLVIQQPSVETGSIIGWIGTRLDDLATMLIIGAGPMMLSIAGKKQWVPSWLMIWGVLAGMAGILGIIGMLTGVSALSFIILPFGMGWMIAAGIVLLKK